MMKKITETSLNPLLIIGFPGQIHIFDSRIHFNLVSIRQILSCRENYDSNSFCYYSMYDISVKGFCVCLHVNLKSALRAFKFATARARRHFHACSGQIQTWHSDSKCVNNKFACNRFA